MPVDQHGDDGAAGRGITFTCIRSAAVVRLVKHQRASEALERDR
jgi:hypothetical protein